MTMTPMSPGILNPDYGEARSNLKPAGREVEKLDAVSLHEAE
jgi:hypothetical protein